tara:strand:+ start:97 stop:513 length:417 start_codon:yes stop_codon:yes gene_type:complete
MAHFAKLGINGKVIAVHVVADKDCQDASGKEDETIGQEFLERLHGWPGEMWKRYSINTREGVHLLGGTPFRGTCAGLGMTYDEENDIFKPKQPFASWTFDIATAHWNPPTPQPNTETDGRPDVYLWNESTQAWDKVVD